MKVIGYARVSTKGQVEKGYGLADQERRIKGWCGRHCHKLVTIYSDGAKSGTLDPTERPGLLDALRALERGEGEALVVADIDRLARTLTVQEAILAQVWKLGATIHTIHGEVLQDDADDPMRTFVRQVMGAVAQLERALVIKRLRNGRAAKAEQGGRAVGAPPYGFRAVDGELEPDPDEQRVLRRLRKWHDQGVTLADMARRLNADGVPSRQGKLWHPMTIKRVLER